MAILFDCPFCSYCKEVPDSYNGKKIKCPRCLATITLGVPQPTALTALPLPEEDDNTIAAAKAIELDSKSLIECPLCFQLINPSEPHCPVYERYHQAEEAGEQMDSKILEEYQHEAKKARWNFFVGLIALVYGIGIVVGPFAIYNGLQQRPHLCSTLESESMKMLDAGILMGAVGTLSSLFVWIGVIF